VSIGVCGALDDTEEGAVEDGGAARDGGMSCEFGKRHSEGVIEPEDGGGKEVHAELEPLAVLGDCLSRMFIVLQNRALAH